MKTTTALLISALAWTAAAPLAAGEKHQKDDKAHDACGAEATVCIREMAVNLRNRGWIGIEWNNTEGPPRISLVVEGSPAAAAGVKAGDVITAFEGVPTDKDDELLWATMKRSLVPGKIITLSILRDGLARRLKVELIAVPEPIVAQWVGKHVLEYHAAADGDQVAKKP